MHLTRASTTLLSTWLLLAGCTRGTPGEPSSPSLPTRSAPSASPEEVERFKKAGLTAPKAVLGQEDTGQVDLAELRDSVADPQIISEEKVAELQRANRPAPADRATGAESADEEGVEGGVAGGVVGGVLGGAVANEPAAAAAPRTASAPPPPP
ncbi:MAG TPA: hypothetical protein VNA24_21645, partial [Hyalangium sp.]|nr:hypothetical protein [Hyalangium sp.]